MAAAVRILIFNCDESFGPPLRSLLLEQEGAKIVAEVDEAVLLPQAVGQFQCDVLVAHLDPLPEAVLPPIAEVAASYPELMIFGISECTDGKLILSAMRSGVREFLTKPIETASLQEGFAKITARSGGEASHGTLVTVIGGAGGVGASTIAVNLAMELKQLSSGNVTVVDLDHRFGQVATMLDVEPTYTIADLCDSPEQVEQQQIERTLVRHKSGLKVLSRPLHFVQADNISAAHCVSILSALTAINDFVVVDGPTRFDYGAKAVLDIADFNLLVLQQVVPTVRSVHRMLEGMSEVGFNLDRMKLVCNRCGFDGCGISVEDIESTLNLKVFSEIPDEWAAVCNSANVGEPLCEAAPRSKVRHAIRDIAQRLAAPDAPPGGQSESRKGGLLSKIF